ncbi:MAG: hypothetical protein J5822_04660 [Eubacteriaceae bacterium]|nr:hypothetical protein [Eubacteriaceae bacterium]
MVKDLDEFASLTEEDVSSADTAHNITGIITGTRVDDAEYDDLSEYFNPADIGMLDFEASSAVERSDREEEPSPDVFGDITEDPVLTGGPEEDTADTDEDPSEDDASASGRRRQKKEKKVKKEKRKGKEASGGEDEAEPDDGSEKTSKSSGLGTALMWILIVILIGAIAFGAVKLLPLLKKDDSLSIINKGESVSNGTVEVTFDEVNVLGSMLTYQFDPNYVYVSVMYTFKNVSGQEQTWEVTPYIMLKPFTKNSNGTLSPLDPEGDEAAELMEIYRSIAPADSFTVPVEGATGEEAQDSSEDSAEEDPLKVLYGEYDFTALQIYSLEKCIEYGSVKDSIPADGERVSADVIKIPRALFETGKYYICMDNQKAAVYIDPTPVDIDSSAPQTPSEPAEPQSEPQEEEEEDDEED